MHEAETGQLANKFFGEQVQRPRKSRKPDDKFRAMKAVSQYGLFTVYTRHSRLERGVRTCRCVCVCGGKVYLTYDELVKRKRRKQGCALLDCPYSAPAIDKLSDPTYVLSKRLTRLLETQPEEVDPEWGGTAYEGVPQASKAAGVASAVRCLQGMTEDTDQSKWHLHRYNEHLPYGPSNCYLDRYLPANRAVLVNGQQTTVKELAELYELPIPVVTTLVDAHEHDGTLLTALIEEGLHEQSNS